MRAAAEQHRQHIGRWFYPCSPVMHAGLADMYVADPRFGEYFEKRAAGLTEFVATAFRENANRARLTVRAVRAAAPTRRVACRAARGDDSRTARSWYAACIRSGRLRVGMPGRSSARRVLGHDGR